jgi:HEPN domain-containing protein
LQRYDDRYRQAERKLDSARWDIEGKFNEDTCFSAQQAAEPAVKALLQSRGRVQLGHSVYQLLQKVEDAPPDLVNAARVLDRHYIPTRYPNGFPDGAPMDFYDLRTAEEAVNYAAAIVGFVGDRL